MARGPGRIRCYGCQTTVSRTGSKRRKYGEQSFTFSFCARCAEALDAGTSLSELRALGAREKEERRAAQEAQLRAKEGTRLAGAGVFATLRHPREPLSSEDLRWLLAFIAEPRGKVSRIMYEFPVIYLYGMEVEEDGGLGPEVRVDLRELIEEAALSRGFVWISSPSE